ncbi:MAG: murein L,D-transpeptidase catalytic domain-containing protein [Bacteriovorax sp.]
MTNKKFIMALVLLSFFAEGVTALEKDDMIELSAAVNGRESANFKKETDNIKKTLPKGTLGKILEKVKFASGNYGLKITVASGENKDQSFWVYYNKKRPLMKLSTARTPAAVDFERPEVARVSIDEANSSQLTEDQPSIVDDPEENAKASLQVNFLSMKKDIDHSTNPVTTESVSDCAHLKELKQEINDVEPSTPPATPREALMNNFLKIGGDPTALKQALCFFDKNKDSTFKAKGDPARGKGITLGNERFITINDQNKNSDHPRFFVLDLETNRVESYFTGHGSGQNKARTKFLNTYEKATHFSNEGGSNLTPRGFFITGSTYNGTYGNSMRLYGLQEGINDNSFLRTVVMHPFKGTEPQMQSSDEDFRPITNLSQTMTKGCTDLSPKYAASIISRIKDKGTRGGSLYYTYTPTEKEAGDNYCGDDRLLKMK